jgi:hypothetical protein
VDGKDIICALGPPVRTQDIIHSAIYLPEWMFNANAINAGDIYLIEWIDQDYFPDASRIVLRPHDSAFFTTDIKEELEIALTQYGILQVDTTIPVRIKALDNFTIIFDVVSLEPANTVLMNGDEVSIEFDTVEDPVPVRPNPEPFDDTVPILPSVAPVGNLLGGISRSTLPDGRAWNPWRI